MAEIPGGKFEFIERVQEAADATREAAAEVKRSTDVFEQQLDLFRFVIEQGLISSKDIANIRDGALRELREGDDPDDGRASVR